MSSIPGLGRSPGGRKWQPTPIILPGKSHGQRNLVGYSPWVAKEWDTTERLNNNQHFISFIVNNIPSYGYTTFYLSIPSSDETFGLFPLFGY